MNIREKLSLGVLNKMPIVLQTEATECGLACLAMIASHYRHNTDLITLRNKFSISSKGATLAELIKVASHLKMQARPLKLDLDHLNKLRLPCILHWDFNHFVVLSSFGPNAIVIHDPARGVRTVTMAELSKSFTGVALEAWPGSNFEQMAPRRPFQIRSLIGRVTGVVGSCMQVLILALALEVVGLIAPFYLQWVIDNVIVTMDKDLLTTLAIGFGMLVLMQQLLIAVRAWVLMYLGTTLNLQWRANVFAHLLRLPVHYFEKRHLGDVVSRFGSIDLIQRTLTTSFLEAVIDGVMTVITLGMMFVYSRSLATVAVIIMLLYAISRCAWYRPLRDATEAQIVHAARQNSHFLESVRGIKSIKLFQMQDDRRVAWLALLVDQINAEVRTQRAQLMYKTLNGVLFGIENMLIIWLGARLTLDGNFTVGVLLAFIAYKDQFNARVSALIDKFFEVKMLRLQGNRLADIVLSEPEESEPSSHLIPGSLVEASLSVSGLRYRYSAHEPYVLNDINFTIAAGESVAVVGPSGCGKTTLMNVLLGFLTAHEGEVLIGGIPLQHLGTEQARQMIGTVLQDDVLFAGSISDNICFFDPNPDFAWIVECSVRAAIAADIASMPMGYGTLVGDMGTVLSGGQKQRVLLARALYKRPRILFLDEATSHLDVDKEQEVNFAVKALKMTTVIIAHRRETIASADRVITLKNGVII